MAECAHESDTGSTSQADSRTLRARQEHAGDRPVYGFLRGGGAPRAPAVSEASHAGTADAFMRTQDAAHRSAEAPVAAALIRAARRHLGRVGLPHGQAVPDFHDRSLAAAAGLEV